MPARYWIETLGCPKNAVDSDKLAGTLVRDGYTPAEAPEGADLVVVNTCAFIEAARAESVETILELAARRRDGARLVVTGCLAERSGEELADALPEVDLVAGFGVPLELGAGPRVRRRVLRGTDGAGLPAAATNGFDLLELDRPTPTTPWAYVKVAEGCDRHCGFCAIPSFRGRQRSRSAPAILAEVDRLADAGVKEIVLVAQDLASYGNDDNRRGALVPLVKAVAERVARVRLLYLYPSALTDGLVDAILATDVAYFDLSLQHVSAPLLRAMRRPGSRARFLARIADIRARAPQAAFRSSFILGYPGETEEDHDALLGFLEEAELDWAGFFTFSEEEGTYAAGLAHKVPAGLATERARECGELQDAITARRRRGLVGEEMTLLIDAPGVGRSQREAPEIDGVVRVVGGDLAVGSLQRVRAIESEGPDLVALPVAHLAGTGARR